MMPVSNYAIKRTLKIWIIMSLGSKSVRTKLHTTFNSLSCQHKHGHYNWMFYSVIDKVNTLQC